MFYPPPSANMDVTSSSGGPITILPQIRTGQPESIWQRSEHMLQTVAKFTSLISEFTRATQQLESVWSGKASESAVKKITDSIRSFESIVKVIENGAKLLNVSGTLVQTAQTGYTTVVSAVNPTVGALMSNPWTYGAAVALSTSTSSALRAFVQGVGAVLKTVGVVQLGSELMQIAQIITEIEALFNGKSASGAANGAATLASTPIASPVTPPQVASALGQQLLNTPVAQPAVPPIPQNTPTMPTMPTMPPGTQQMHGAPIPGTGIPGTGNQNLSYVGPATGSTGATLPINDPNDTWIPVDPASSNPAGGHDISVSITENGVTHTVSTQAGTPTDATFDVTNAAGQHTVEHISIDAHGSINMSERTG